MGRLLKTLNYSMLILLAVGLTGSIGLWFSDAAWLRTALEAIGFVCALLFFVSVTLDWRHKRNRE